MKHLNYITRTHTDSVIRLKYYQHRFFEIYTFILCKILVPNVGTLRRVPRPLLRRSRHMTHPVTQAAIFRRQSPTCAAAVDSPAVSAFTSPFGGDRPTASARQTGHNRLFLSHESTHGAWKMCSHRGSRLHRSSGSKGSRHTAQSPATPPPSSAAEVL
jgi:hypothetical protein